MRFTDIISTEFFKLRRSKVTWITFAAYTFMVAIAGFFMWMMKNPALAEKLGLLGQKAKFAFGGQQIDWTTFLDFIVEMGGIGGLIMCSVIATYIFGREYADGMAKNLLALPVRRSAFVLAKFIVAAMWFGLLTLWIVPLSRIVGGTVGLGNPAAGLLSHAATRLLVLAIMSLCCSTLTAWVAVETKGYFAPLGFCITTLVLASVFGATGWGPWVPWSIVGIYSGMAGPGISLSWGSYLVVAMTAAAGAALVVRHETFADNAQ